MRRPTGAQVGVARRLFALEAREGGATAEDYAAAAGRIHEKLFARLTALVGAAAARALFLRSLRLTAVEFPYLGKVVLDPNSAESEPLVQCLRAQEPEAVEEATVALCAALLSLLETLIGERLTANVLRSAWPAFDVTTRRPGDER